MIDAIEPSRDDSTRPNVKDKWYNKMVTKVCQEPLKFVKWRYTDGKLFKYVKQDYPTLSGDTWKEVVPKENRLQIIRDAHDPPISGHMGVYKTYNRLCEKYYWPKMRQDVGSYVKSCLKCGAHKDDPRGPSDQMVSHSKPSRPWEMISTDLVGPLPRSYKGNTFILVVTDYLSKFSLIFPLRRASTQLIINRIEEQVFLVFGVPRVLLCDNGPQYRSKEFRKFTDQYQCRIKFNANYHPRANPTERQNKTLKTMLSIYTHENHRRWDQNIPQIACAIRTACQETTKLSPYFINFGRNMCVSGKDYDNDAIIKDEDGTQTLECSRNEQFRKLFNDVKTRLEAAAEKNICRYNLRKRHEEYVPGQLVWRRNFELSNAANYFSKKLAPKYIGPFTIHRRISPWTYELKDKNGYIQPGSWHSKDLKPAWSMIN